MSSVSVVRSSLAAIFLIIMPSIADAASTGPVGALSGDANVDVAGSAGYTIPMVIPNGTSGVQPKLSFSYNSYDSDDGVMGLGWDLDGVDSKITRCGKNTIEDNTATAVTFTSSDKFCLNGSSLVAITGTYGANGTIYYTKSESFTKVISYGVVGAGPAYFKVWTKSGDVMEFGNTADSFVEHQGRTDGSAIQWSLNKVSDRYDNYQTYQYVEVTTTGEHYIDSISYTGNTAQALTPINKIQFVYENRPDVRVGYVANGAIRGVKRLKTVQTKTNNAVVFEYRIGYVVDPTTAENNKTNQTKVSSIQQCSLVSTVEQCITATNFGWQSNVYQLPMTGAVATLYTSPLEVPTDTLNMKDKMPAMGDVNGDGFVDATWFTSPSTTRASPFRFVAKTKFGVGDGTFSTAVTTLDAVTDVLPNGSKFCSSKTNTFLMDMNGDGRNDLVCRNTSVITGGGTTTSTLILQMAPNLGNGQFGPIALKYSTDINGSNYAWSPYILDLNSDGLPDAVWVLSVNGTSTKVRAVLNSTSGTFTALPEATIGGVYTGGTAVYQNVQDINGDTYPDLITANINNNPGQLSVKTYLGTGSGTFQATAIANVISAGSNFNNTAWKINVGDENGDGKLDFIMTNASSSGLMVNVVYGKGDGNFVAGNSPNGLTIITNLATPGFDYSDSKWTTSIADMNADGKDDIVWSISNTARLATSVSLSAGSSTTGAAIYNKPVEITAATGNFDDSPATGGCSTVCYSDYLADVNNDGITDIMWAYRDANNMRIYYVVNATTYPLITSATDALGNQAQFIYKKLTDSSVYTKGTGATFPVVDATPTDPVVYQLKTSNGIGGFNTTQYKYEGKRYDLRGPDLNFSKIETINFDTNAKEVNEYANDAAAVTARKEGTLIRSRTYAPNGKVVSDTTNTWNVQNINTGLTRFLYTSPSVTLTCDPDAVTACDATNALARVTTTTTYNSYGDPTQIATTTVDKTYGTYTKTVNNAYWPADTTNWILGRLNTTTVTSTAPNQTAITRKSSFTYNAIGILTDETIEPNNATLMRKKHYDFNAFGEITATTESWPANTTQLSFNSRVSTDVYDAQGRFKTSSKNALNQLQSFQYDALKGTLISATDANNLTVSWATDEFGRQIKETRPDGSVTTTTHAWCDAVSNPCPANAKYTVTVRACAAGVAVCDATTPVTSSIAPTVEYYDSLNRLIRKKTPGLYAANVIYQDTQYDSLGRVWKTSLPYYVNNGVPDAIYWTTTTYDHMNRPQVITNAENNTKSIAYSGFTTTVTNELNQVSIQRKNALDQLMQAEDNAGGKITYTYDSIGNLLRTTDPANNTVNMTYDLLGNKITMNDPDLGSWTYTYNGLGLLATQTDNKGVVTKMDYDVLGRMKSRIDDVNAVLGSADTSTWTYDTQPKGVGKLTSAVSPGFAQTNSYDTLGRLSSVVNSVNIDGTVTNYTSSNTYDAYSRVATSTYPTNYTVTNKWNNQGYVDDIRGPNNVILKQVGSLSVFGQENDVFLGSAGVEQIRTFNPKTGRMEYLQVRLGASDLVKQQYQFNKIGNLDLRKDLIKDVKEDFTYDNLNRLKTAATTKNSNGQAIGTTVTVNYDALGNITYKSDVGNYSYASTCGTNNIAGPHAVSAISGIKNTSYCYDKNGNMISGDDRTITYSSFNKPISILKGTNRVDMQYDVDRHLVVRKDITGSGTTTTTMLGSYEKVEDGSGITHKLYIGDFAVVIQKSGQADKTNYFHKDHLGSTVAITDQNGAIAEYFSFDAWGKRRNVDATAVINDIQYISLSSQLTNKGFTGHEQLDPVGLIHMDGRVYDPTIGRFLSADPFIQAPDSTQSYNRYSYVMNNPLSLTDPTGYFSVGGFLGSVFSGLIKLVKAIVKTNLQIFRAIVVRPVQWAFRQLARNQYLQMAAQIAACTVGTPLGCAAFAAASAYVATDGNWGAAFTAGVTAYAMAYTAQSVKLGTMDGWSAAAFSIGMGGASSAAQGGSFRSGAITSGLPMAGGGNVAMSIMLSGVASKITGGKFVDGVKTAAFSYAARGLFDGSISFKSLTAELTKLDGVTIYRIETDWFGGDPTRDTGHYWVELDMDESYGWYPGEEIDGSMLKFLGGVDGDLNGVALWAKDGATPTGDLHHGDLLGEAYDVYVADGRTSSFVKQQIRDFANSYSSNYGGRYSYFEDCHAFQQRMIRDLNLTVVRQ